MHLKVDRKLSSILDRKRDLIFDETVSKTSLADSFKKKTERKTLLGLKKPVHLQT